MKLAVSSSEGHAVCYVPYNSLESVTASGSVTVEGETYVLSKTGKTDYVVVTEEMDPYLRIAGDLEVGDMTVTVPLETAPADGVHSATAVTESLQPIKLLLQ